MSVLSDQLVKEFVKITRDTPPKKSESFAYGEVVSAGENMLVKFDGADNLTPCTSTVSVAEGDRVVVMLKNRQAVITSNISNPTVNTERLEAGTITAREKYRIYMADGNIEGAIDAIKMSKIYFADDDSEKTTLTIGSDATEVDEYDDPVPVLEAVQFINPVYCKEGIAPQDVWVTNSEVNGYVWIGTHDLIPGSLYDGPIVRSEYVCANSKMAAPDIYGTLHSTSDRRLKRDIKDTDENDALGKLNRIKHRKFTWIHDDVDESLGYISQELQEIDPGLVNDDGSFCSINNLHLIALATKAIQELSSKVNHLERRVKELEFECNSKLSNK